MDIKPIETRYKGYRMRSRTEARWAVFFDALGIEWEYESEGYDTGEHGWYLPDFAVIFRGRKMLMEVKAVYPTDLEIKKARSVGACILSGIPGVDAGIYSYVVVEPSLMFDDDEDGNIRKFAITNHYVFCGCRYCHRSIGLESSFCVTYSESLTKGMQRNGESCFEGCFTCC